MTTSYWIQFLWTYELYLPSGGLVSGFTTNLRCTVYISSLYSGATYEKESLTLPGTAGSYATSPAFAIQSTSFTLAFWIKVESCLNRNYYVYSHWSGPYLFAYAIRWNSGKCIFSFQARGATVCVSGCDLLSVSGGLVESLVWKEYLNEHSANI